MLAAAGRAGGLVRNPSKAKGDRAEREAVAELVSLAPDLVSVHNPQRKLGAGRAEDTGDLWVFHDVAIQVRSYDTSRLGIAIRSAAVDAVVQATNAGVPYALGMVPIPGSRKGTVRWLACGLDWPDSGPTPDSRTDGPLVDLRDGPCRQPVEFRQVGRAITWLRNDDGPYGYEARPREARVARLPQITGPWTAGDTRGGGVLVAPVEAWITAFRRARGGRSANAPPTAA